MGYSRRLGYHEPVLSIDLEYLVRILGIDPGSRATGWGVISCKDGCAEATEWGVIRPSLDGSFEDRLLTIQEGLLKVVLKFTPSHAAVEDPFHARSVASALKLGQVRGVVVVTLRQEKISVASYSPREVKKAVSGFGGAEKSQVARMIQSIFGLSEPPTPSDAADAMAIALCHVHTAGLGTAGAPATRRKLRHPIRG